jgi:hypothetical protein
LKTPCPAAALASSASIAFARVPLRESLDGGVHRSAAQDALVRTLNEPRDEPDRHVGALDERLRGGLVEIMTADGAPERGAARELGCGLFRSRLERGAEVVEQLREDRRQVTAGAESTTDLIVVDEAIRQLQHLFCPSTILRVEVTKTACRGARQRVRGIFERSVRGARVEGAPRARRRVRRRGRIDARARRSTCRRS